MRDSFGLPTTFYVPNFYHSFLIWKIIISWAEASGYLLIRKNFDKKVCLPVIQKWNERQLFSSNRMGGNVYRKTGSSSMGNFVLRILTVPFESGGTISSKIFLRFGQKNGNSFLMTGGACWFLRKSKHMAQVRKTQKAISNYIYKCSWRVIFYLKKIWNVFFSSLGEVATPRQQKIKRQNFARTWTPML
jgi:hypothetical protein